MKVVCLGGGYVALFICRTFRSAMRRGDIELTVIDRNNFHTFHGLIPEMLTGNIQPTNCLSPAREIFKGSRFLCGDIDAIDLRAKTVEMSRTLDGRQFTVDYDHLVVCMGSDDDLARYPGIAEHAHRLKSYADCFNVRNQIITMLELAAIETDEEERKRLLTFVVAGGNYAGVEVASGLAEFLPNVIRKSYPDLQSEDCRVVLVVSGKQIIPELGNRFPKLVSAAEKMLADTILEILTETRLEAATPEEAILSEGTRIATRTIISCTGSAQNPLLETISTERDKRGRLITDEYLRVKGYDNIWSGGDCAAVPMVEGGTAPPLALFAMNAGKQIGKNLLALQRGKTLKPYRFTGLGDACLLGTRKAVGQLMGVPLQGMTAWLAWRFTMIVYLPSFERKLRVLIDWLFGPFFGNDILNIKVTAPLGISRAIYEPGQTIIKEGDIGVNLYVIQSGTVEVIKQTPDGPQILATLGAGTHFGERSIFEKTRRTASVLAKTSVETLVIRQEAALELSRSLDSLGRQLSQSPGKQ